VYYCGKAEKLDNLFIVMGKIYDYKKFDLSFKDIDAKDGIVTGYFASYNTVDSDNDVFLPGTFSKSISENFNRIKHLLDHNITKAVGKIQVLKEDSYGLYYESKIGTHKLGKDFLEMAQSGLITEHSVGFMNVKGKSQMREGINYISEGRLMEGSSLQAWGANENTPLTGIKSFYQDAEKLEKRIKSIEAFCRNSEASDETIELLLIEIKQLSQLLSDMSTPAADEAQVPEKKAATIDASLILTYLSL